MRNLIITILFSLLLVLSCATAPEPVEEIVVVEEPVVIEESEPVLLVMPADDSLILPNNVNIRETERGSVLVTGDKIIFEFADSDLPTNADYILGDIIKTILENNPNLRIILEAHTSNRGIAYPYNYQLSVARAYAGKQYLVNLGIGADRVIEMPLGESLVEFYTQRELRRYEFVLIENEEDLARYKEFVSKLDLKAETSDDVIEYNRMKEVVLEEETIMEENNDTNFEILIIENSTEEEEVYEESILLDEDIISEENK